MIFAHDPRIGIKESQSLARIPDTVVCAMEFITLPCPPVSQREEDGRGGGYRIGSCVYPNYQVHFIKSLKGLSALTIHPATPFHQNPQSQGQALDEPGGAC